MRWQRGSRSENLEDRRGSSGSARAGRSLGRNVRVPMPRGRGGKLSLGSIVIMLAAMYFLGIDPMTILGGAAGGGGLGGGLSAGVSPDSRYGGAPPVSANPTEEQHVDFISFALDDIQNTWGRKLPGYRDAKLVLFRDATRSGCGMGQSEMGPFYCPADEKAYIDLAFYEDLRSRFGAPGDFAEAYVLAHEIGHHIQNITGIERKVRDAQRANPAAKNEYSIKLELQADCLAGVWGHEAGKRGVLEPGDIEEGLRAAAAIGDDRIQKMSGRGVHPESWTHGSSAQRQRWLDRGLRSGDPNDCDSFSAGAGAPLG